MNEYEKIEYVNDFRVKIIYVKNNIENVLKDIATELQLENIYSFGKIAKGDYITYKLSERIGKVNERYNYGIKLYSVIPESEITPFTNFGAMRIWGLILYLNGMIGEIYNIKHIIFNRTKLDIGRYQIHMHGFDYIEANANEIYDIINNHLLFSDLSVLVKKIDDIIYNEKRDMKLLLLRNRMCFKE